VLLKTLSCFSATISFHFLLQAIAGDIGLGHRPPRSLPCLPPSSLQVAAGAPLLEQGPPDTALQRETLIMRERDVIAFTAEL
jgi:hypothetical protein